MHLIPVDVADLPRHRRADGFDNRDFGFQKYGVAFDGICVVVVPLPDYDIVRAGTGQFVPGAWRLWTAEFRQRTGLRRRGGGYAEQREMRNWGGAAGLGRVVNCPIIPPLYRHSLYRHSGESRNPAS